MCPSSDINRDQCHDKTRETLLRVLNADAPHLKVKEWKLHINPNVFSSISEKVSCETTNLQSGWRTTIGEVWRQWLIEGKGDFVQKATEEKKEHFIRHGSPLNSQHLRESNQEIISVLE